MERAFYYLRDSGLVKFHGESSNLKISLTEKAKKFLVKVGFRTASVNKPKVWDKKWWLVAADIPTKEHRLGADQFRAKLKNMNFYFLQKSLWIYPYDPRKEIKFIAETYGIERFITVMEINRLDVEDESKAKQFFGL
jgi:DNA-binding transcriptional regulator PaaX